MSRSVQERLANHVVNAAAEIAELEDPDHAEPLAWFDTLPAKLLRWL